MEPLSMLKGRFGAGASRKSQKIKSKKGLLCRSNFQATQKLRSCGPRGASKKQKTERSGTSVGNHLKCTSDHGKLGQTYDQDIRLESGLDQDRNAGPA